MPHMAMAFPAHTLPTALLSCVSPVLSSGAPSNFLPSFHLLSPCTGCELSFSLPQFLPPSRRSRRLYGTGFLVCSACGGGKKKVVEERWCRFFSDPSLWWDHRLGKTSTRYPDFKHKKTGEALWVHDNANPGWVKPKLAVMKAGLVQLPVVYWNKKLARYVREGQDEKTIELFGQIIQDGRIPDTFTFVQVLKACGRLQNLEEGRQIHEKIVQTGCERDLFVGSSLIDMYTKCRKPEEARRVFNKMPERDVIAWTSMIMGYAKCSLGKKALELYEQMQVEGVKPVSLTFVGVLKACASLSALSEGRLVHGQITGSGCETDSFVGSGLVSMYAKCGSIDDAERVFSNMGTVDVVSWTAMIMGYVKCGQGQKALELYGQMKVKQVNAVPLTFVGVLNACASLAALEEGRSVHKDVIESGYESHVFVGTSLVDMYAKCGSIKEALSVFHKMAMRNVVSWNAMLTGYIKCGQAQKALALYRQMQLEGVEAVPVTFVLVLNACASVLALEEGRRVHAQIIISHCELDVFVGGSLIDMYAKCCSIEDAWKVFNKMPTRDVIAWTALVTGYAKCGQGKKALELYQQMQLEDVEPAPDTFALVVEACDREDTLQKAKGVYR